MASVTQKRVLLGLQAGLKLREVLQEPHMPSLRMLDEWLTNPEFNVLYLAAQSEGQIVRNRLTIKKHFMEPTPDPELKVVLPPTVDIFAPEYIAWPDLVPTAADIAKLEPLIDDAFYATTLPLAIDDDTLKQLLMQRLREGEFSSKMVDNTPGFYADKLQAWRKEADFVAEWNAARAVGRDKRKVDSLLRDQLPPVAPVSDFLVVEPVVNSHTPTPPVAELPVATDPAMEYLPEGMVRRYVVLKAEESYDCLMSLEDAQRFAQSDCTHHGNPFYIAQVIAVAAPVTTSVLHPIA